jgi:hypothetical protein
MSSSGDFKLVSMQLAQVTMNICTVSAKKLAQTKNLRGFFNRLAVHEAKTFLKNVCS